MSTLIKIKFRILSLLNVVVLKEEEAEAVVEVKVHRDRLIGTIKEVEHPMIETINHLGKEIIKIKVDRVKRIIRIGVIVVMVKITSQIMISIKIEIIKEIIHMAKVYTVGVKTMTIWIIKILVRLMKQGK